MSDEKQETAGPFDSLNEIVASVGALFGFGDEPEPEPAPVDGSGAIETEGVEVDAARE